MDPIIATYSITVTVRGSAQDVNTPTNEAVEHAVENAIETLIVEAVTATAKATRTDK